jgi:hypothetical protein
MRIEFNFGEVLPTDDPLALWVVRLAMIHNDLVFANKALMDAAADPSQSFERLFWWRYSIAAYHEAMTLFSEEKGVSEVSAFVAELSEEARDLHDEAVGIFQEVVASSSHVRNESTFHYPGGQSKKALQAALQDLAESEGLIDGGESTKVKDSRFVFADEVVGKLFYRAVGGTDEAMQKIVERIAQGEKALMQFINHAMDQFFVSRLGGTSETE